MLSGCWLVHTIIGGVQVKENDVNAALDTFTKAIEQYQKVVALDPADTGSWCWLGYIAEALTMGWGEKVQEYAGEMRNSSGGNPIAQLSQVREMGKLQSLRDKYKKVASHALSQAQRRFPLINPAEQPAQMEEAMEAVCALAELYSQGGSTWLPKSVSWFRLVANVDTDAFPLDFPEQSKNNVIEYKSLAQRRLVVLEDDIARGKKESKSKTVRWFVTFGVVFFSIIAICVCLIVLIF